MRRLIIFNMVTIDGYFEALNGSIDWHNTDTEFTEFSVEQLHTVDILLFGRKTYDLMQSFWQTAAAKRAYPEVADLFNSLPKIVATKVLKSVKLNNTRFISKNLRGELLALKEHPGRDILIMGSANLSATLRRQDLIDEYRLMVNPVVLGKGRPFFKNENNRLKLRLIKVRLFNSGNVLLCYKPISQ